MCILAIIEHKIFKSIYYKNQHAEIYYYYD